jgi:gluconate kinase
MPASLLASQFATLEPPGADEPAVMLSAAKPVPLLVDEAVAALKLG